MSDQPQDVTNLVNYTRRLEAAEAALSAAQAEIERLTEANTVLQHTVNDQAARLVTLSALLARIEGVRQYAEQLRASTIQNPRGAFGRWKVKVADELASLVAPRVVHPTQEDTDVK